MDNKAKRILLSYFWSAQGWIDNKNRNISESDLAYAKQKGMMFEDLSFTHDSLVKEIKTLTKKISFSEVVSAFVYSLDSRALNFRSCLSSYVLALNLPLHSHNKQGVCSICGCFDKGVIDLSVLNFERYKWGGVRLLSLEFVWFDLMRFNSERHKIEHENFKKINILINSLVTMPKGLSAGKVQQQISKQIKSNKPEREILLGILGICNILNHPEHQGFLYNFVESKNMELPNQRFIDLEYPFCWYNSEFGINKKALNDVFGI